MRRVSGWREWLSRVRGMPARIDRIDRVSEHLDAASHSLLASAGEAAVTADALRSRLQRLESEVAWTRESQQAQSEALLLRLEQQAELLSQLQTRQTSELAGLIAQVAHGTGVDLEATLAPARDAALAELLAGLAVETRRVEGLSVMIITWNHGAWLPQAIESAHRSLELLPENLAGKILIFDDASTDETAAVLHSLAGDPRIRVIRSTVNLSLARARNVLLAACTTTHAVILDADNRLSPSGVVDVFEVAAKYRPAITFGNVLASTESASGQRAEWDAFAYAPSPQSLRNGYCFDSMAIVDVEAIVESGGYSTDPQLAGLADDLELLLRTLRQGRAVAFVPAVLGFYRKTLLRHSTTGADHKSVENRIERRSLYDDPDFEQFVLFGAHRDTGILWASAAATALVGAPSARPLVPLASLAAGPRVLVVAPGGVGNIGDDAISACAVRRIRREYPTARIEMISDRGLPLMGGPAVPWIGTVLQAWAGLSSTELANGAALSDGLASVQDISSRTTATPLLNLGSYQAAFFLGGGNLATAFAQDLLRPRVALALCLAAAGVQVVVSGQGVGPCSEDELNLVRFMSNHAIAFGCRDIGSVDFINPTSVSGAELIGDDAMAVSATDAEQLESALRSANAPLHKFLVFHAREASYVANTNLTALTAAVDQLASQAGLSVLGVAVNNNAPPELELLASIAQSGELVAPWSVIDSGQSVELAVGLLARASAVVTHSYHLALWALQAGTPAVLVADSDYYQLKADGLAALAGFPGGISITSTATTSEIDERLEQVKRWLGQSQLPAVAERVEAWWSAQLANALESNNSAN